VDDHGVGGLTGPAPSIVNCSNGLNGSLLGGLATQLRRPTFASIALRACSPCFSLFFPLFSLFRRGSGFDSPLKTVCFQMVDQRTLSRAEQDDNSEIIRA
jgi:hypothetical protein